MASVDDLSSMKTVEETVLLSSCLKRWTLQCRSKSWGSDVYAWTDDTLKSSKQLTACFACLKKKQIPLIYEYSK